MQPTTRTARQRNQLISNILATAARNGYPVVLAAWLDKPVRIYDPVTDHPKYITIRLLLAHDVRCD